MVYSIKTKDGITINNIPDDVAPDSDVLKQRVAAIRAGGTDGSLANDAASGILGSGLEQSAVKPDIATMANEFASAKNSGDLERAEQIRLQMAKIQGESAAGSVEAALTMGSGIIAEPIAGIAGIAQGLNPFADDGAAKRAVEGAREALTYQPRTESGQDNIKSLGETLAPVGELIESVETGLGDATFEATGSPALAAAAASFPTLIMEVVGLKGGGKIARGTKPVKASNRAVKKMMTDAAPVADDIKAISRRLYKELDDSGVALKPKVYEGMVNKVRKAGKSQGLSPRTTPKAYGAIQDMEDLIGGSPTLTEIDDLRKVANGVANSIEKTEAAIGSRIVSEIDDFLDGVSPKALASGGIPASQIGVKYKAARNLWGRASKSELLTAAVKDAEMTASGLENGIRIEINKILRNKKKSKYFNASEKEAMRDLVKGDTAQNFAKLIGRFGFSEGRATNVLASLGGVGAGGVIGGGAGAFAVPAIGTAARKVAQNLTKGKAKFIETMTRAGADGEKISRAYLQAIPANKRSISELSSLLSDPSINLEKLFKSSSKKVREAAEIAAGRQVIGEAIGVAAPVAIQTEE